MKSYLLDAMRLSLLIAVLDTLVLCKKTAFYSDIAPMLDMHHRDPRFHRLLGKVMEIDHGNAEPARSSLIINKKTLMPGDDYFTKTEEMMGHALTCPQRDAWEDEMGALGVPVPRGLSDVAGI